MFNTPYVHALQFTAYFMVILIVCFGCDTGGNDGITTSGGEQSIVAEFDNTDTLSNDFSLGFSMNVSARLIRAVWDLSTSQGQAYFDTCEEPPGIAANLQFTPINGEDVGLTTTFTPCELNGAQTLLLEFNNFERNQRFFFNIDTEDKTNELYVSGANFAGSTLTVAILVNGMERRFRGTFERTGQFAANAMIPVD